MGGELNKEPITLIKSKTMVNKFLKIRLYEEVLELEYQFC